MNKFLLQVKNEAWLSLDRCLADTLERVDLSVEKKAADFQWPNVWIRELLSPVHY